MIIHGTVDQKNYFWDMLWVNTLLLLAFVMLLLNVYARRELEQRIEVIEKATTKEKQ